MRKKGMNGKAGDTEIAEEEVGKRLMMKNYAAMCKEWSAKDSVLHIQRKNCHPECSDKGSTGWPISVNKPLLQNIFG